MSSSPTTAAARSEQLDGLTDHVCGFLDADLLRELAVGFVDRPSPTGEERALAEWAVGPLPSQTPRSPMQRPPLRRSARRFPAWPRFWV